MSADGTRVAIGAIQNDGTAIDAGHVRVFSLPNSPSAPTINSVTAGNNSVTVSFTTAADGGLPITNYKYSIDGTNYVALNPATTVSPFTISGLTNGTTYVVTIKAITAVGDSLSSNAISQTPVAPPTTPTESSSTLSPANSPVVSATPAAASITAPTVEKARSLPVTGGDLTNIVFISVLFVIGGIVFNRLRRVF
jgi:hypothetical protein